MEKLKLPRAEEKEKKKKREENKRKEARKKSKKRKEVTSSSDSDKECVLVNGQVASASQRKLRLPSRFRVERRKR